MSAATATMTPAEKRTTIDTIIAERIIDAAIERDCDLESATRHVAAHILTWGDANGFGWTDAQKVKVISEVAIVGEMLATYPI